MEAMNGQGLLKPFAEAFRGFRIGQFQFLHQEIQLALGHIIIELAISHSQFLGDIFLHRFRQMCQHIAFLVDLAALDSSLRSERFFDGFMQLTIIFLMAGLFDRLFIDWWWVGHTKAWIIPGTEEFMPYIYGKTLVTKWCGTLIGFPLLAAAIAGIMQLVCG